MKDEQTERSARRYATDYAHLLTPRPDLTDDELIELVTRASVGDVRGRNRLVEHNARLAAKISHSFLATGDGGEIEFHDYFQEGLSAIAHSIDCLTRQGMFPLPRRTFSAYLSSSINRGCLRLRHKQAGMGHAAYREGTIAGIRRGNSLDERVRSHQQGSAQPQERHAFVSSREAFSVEEIAELRAEARRIRELALALPRELTAARGTARQRTAFELRYGIENGSLRIAELEKVGAILGTTREAVRQKVKRSWQLLASRGIALSDESFQGELARFERIAALVPRMPLS